MKKETNHCPYLVWVAPAEVEVVVEVVEDLLVEEVVVVLLEVEEVVVLVLLEA